MSNDTPNIPYGYCQCGCGQKTKIASRSNTRDGCVKGEPFRYLKGHRPKTDISNRFWSKVAITANPNKCWEWTAYLNPNGYGQIGLGRRKEGISLAHRIAWELTYGKIPEGLNVLHNCPDGDNPACCNPTHLFLGTQSDNVHDMIQKGRQVALVGEHHPSHKLTDKQVKYIRTRYTQGGISKAELAKQIGVSISTLNGILSYRIWKHI